MIIRTKDIREHIESLKLTAKNNGQAYLDLISLNIHKNLNLKNRMPMVCNSMRQVMNKNDLILNQTPSGYSSTFKVRYYL